MSLRHHVMSASLKHIPKFAFKIAQSAETDISPSSHTKFNCASLPQSML